MPGLCHLCAHKSAFLKTIKRSSANALRLIHSLLFKRDYYLREQVQDEFRGLEVAAFAAIDLASHFKEFAKKSSEPNLALDILVFVKVRIIILNLRR